MKLLVTLVSTIALCNLAVKVAEVPDQKPKAAHTNTGRQRKEKAKAKAKIKEKAKTQERIRRPAQ